METINLLDDDNSKKGNSGITGDMMEDLMNTAGFLRYLGMLGMIVCGLLTLLMFIGVFNAAGISKSGRYPDNSIIMLLFLAMMLCVGAGFVSLLVYRYGSNLKKYTLYKDIRYFDEAVENNKNLWVIIGFFILFTFSIFFFVGLYAGASS